MTHLGLLPCEREELDKLSERVGRLELAMRPEPAVLDSPGGPPEPELRPHWGVYRTKYRDPRLEADRTNDAERRKPDSPAEPEREARTWWVYRPYGNVATYASTEVPGDPTAVESREVLRDKDGNEIPTKEVRRLLEEYARDESAALTQAEKYSVENGRLREENERLSSELAATSRERDVLRGLILAGGNGDLDIWSRMHGIGSFPSTWGDFLIACCNKCLDLADKAREGK